MINITYTIDFAEPGKALACFVFPEELESKMISMRSLAQSMGCGTHSDVNTEYTHIVITHSWPTQAAIDSFVEAANKILNYEEYFAEYEKYIETSGGTLVRTVTEV
jgi:hypothetical protein